MSRSAVARRFNEAIGLASMTYLSRWRMALAKAALVTERLTLDQVAERTGYGSASALSHAFLRIVGCTPTTYRQQQGPEPDTEEHRASGTSVERGSLYAEQARLNAHQGRR